MFNLLKQIKDITNKVRLCERSEPQSNRLLDKPGVSILSNTMKIAFLCSKEF